MNIQTFDLNLLKVFAAIYAERNVSRAGPAVGLSQPAVSNALQRLRKTCSDPLFVRVAGGVEPTALAEALAGPVRQALTDLERALESGLAFDPARVDRQFRLLTSDVGETTVLPRLMERLAIEAPGVSVEAERIPHQAYREALQDGRADLAIGHLDFLKAGFYQQRLFNDSYCCIAAAGHPKWRGRIGLSQYVEADHIYVTSGNADSQVDKELARKRRRRTIRLRVTHYHTAVEVVATSALVATVPRRAVAGAKGIQTFPVPFALNAAEVRQFWHRRVHQDPGNRWFRNMLLSLELDR